MIEAIVSRAPLLAPSERGLRQFSTVVINYTHPMKKDVKKKSISPPLWEMRVW
jgi:hypothetical protein